MSSKAPSNPAFPITKVTDEYLDYWIQNHIGGSGLSVSIQARLRDMALEIQHHRLTNPHPYEV